jgi:outer membrane lipoprotein-sorting protein
VQFLRRISSKRLALLCAAVLAVIAGGTALALAAASGGPVPARKPLANAVHDALASPDQQGVTARVRFTNNLLSGIDLRGSNPILGGADGRLWATNDGHFRLELQASGGGADAQIVSDGKSFWVYDGSSNTVYRGTVPADHGAADHGKAHDRVPSVSRIQTAIDKLMRDASVSAPQPGNTAGEPSYTVRTSPRRDGGLLGALELAWDANTGAPLRAAVYARGASTPVIELKATDISFGPVASSVFDVTPPAGAKTQAVHPPSGNDGGTRHAHGKPVTGLARVQKGLHFQLAAPARVAGRSRAGVALLGKGNGAVVTYGRGLGGIAVVQQQVKPGSQQKNPLGRTELPTVSINGTSAQELSTPLGTVLRFQRGDVMYVVAGSAPRAAVESAARGL